MVEENRTLNLVSLATGTKCVTGEPSKVENVIVDCHAEVLARRGLKRYLMAKLDADQQVGANFMLHLFISQLPCGTLDRYRGSREKGKCSQFSRI